ncbi:beta-ketoacyl-ACP synthase III [Longispora sp. NPDC051575]|uniref:beta-ketoacyl-ACP synthase III n=1 Tax=Longispora sp. NPDC051575 TaxID=3154943 RepID=UPI00341BA98A
MESYGSVITGLADYRPTNLVTNEELSKSTTVTPEWIEDRTGIRSRHHAGPEETIVAMAAEAGRKAITMAGIDYTDIDLVILATASRYQRMPGAAPQVASTIGLPNAGAFDVNAVCAGFTYSLALASNAVRCGDAKHALVVGAERTSDWINPETPDTYAIFGDGAGAAIVSRSDKPGIFPAVWGSDGKRAPVLELSEFPELGREYVTMDGPLVYKWATSNMPKAAKRAAARAGVELSDVKWLVMHQANKRILDTVARALRWDDEHVARDVVEAGNTSAASVPLALTRLYESGRTSPGDLVLTLGFGAGLTYAGQIVTMP